MYSGKKSETWFGSVDRGERLCDLNVYEAVLPFGLARDMAVRWFSMQTCGLVYIFVVTGIKPTSAATKVNALPAVLSLGLSI